LPEEPLRGFAAVRVVEAGVIKSVGQSNALGVREASAPVVALAEDHAFPEPDWARVLIEAHEGPWSVVGPVVCNFNPDSTVSRADFLVGYGPWSDKPHRSGEEVAALPGHNSSYKRDVLLALGVELEAALHAETVLHWRLHAEGHRLWLEPKARLHHTNFALWRIWLPVQFHQGRMFAASRAAGWSRNRRLLYALASPLIPLVRLWRTVRASREAARPDTFMALIIGFLCDGLGQMFGYAAGGGRSAERLLDMEFGRVRHVTRRDRQMMAALENSLTNSKPTTVW
jgi:hypothetical protein